MSDREDVTKPKEGLKTLVAQFTFIQFEPAIKEVKELRAEGVGEKEILRHIETAHADFDESTRKKIYSLSLGLTPHDDIRPEQIADRRNLSDTTVEIELRKGDDWTPGAVLFFEGRRWVLTSLQGRTLSLKLF